MKWPGEAIGSIYYQKNKQTNKKKIIFFHCFSRISWLHLPKLLRNHCILTKQIFWMIKVGFYIIFFHPRPLPDHLGKISVLMKNQGTSYLKWSIDNFSNLNWIIKWSNSSSRLQTTSKNVLIHMQYACLCCTKIFDNFPISLTVTTLVNSAGNW